MGLQAPVGLAWPVGTQVGYAGAFGGIGGTGGTGGIGGIGAFTAQFECAGYICPGYP